MEGRTPDWRSIYAMELEVYGRTFDHGGAPPPFGLSGGMSYMNIEMTINRQRALAGFPPLPPAPRRDDG